MKQQFRSTIVLAVLAVSSAVSARAFTYNDEDLLLVFRKDGANDVEFNLGGVSQFLGQTSGFQAAVTNWDTSLVTANYNFTDDGVRVILLAATRSDATNKRVWLSSANSTTVVLDRTPSQWQVLQSKIDGIGSRPQDYTETNSSRSFEADPSFFAAYSFIASNRGSVPALLPQLGGDSAFTVETAIPGKLLLYEITPSTANPKPQATVVGNFVIDSQGALVFTAAAPVAPPAPTQITSVVNNGGTVTVTFNTVAGVHYRLGYADHLGASPTTWTTGSGSVLGTGSAGALQDVPGGTRFYVVESFQ